VDRSSQYIMALTNRCLSLLHCCDLPLCVYAQTESLMAAAKYSSQYITALTNRCLSLSHCYHI
jgi:hypothetical protein